jgi:hypothetical protein
VTTIDLARLGNGINRIEVAVAVMNRSPVPRHRIDPVDEELARPTERKVRAKEKTDEIGGTGWVLTKVLPEVSGLPASPRKGTLA